MESNHTGLTEQLFEEVFKTHFRNLYSYALTILKEENQAEEIVQQVFFKLWEKREKVVITQSLNAYLYRSVHNECLNFLKHQKVKRSYHSYIQYTMREEENSTPGIQEKELASRISYALQQLPQQCRTIFQMSRFENLKYREIAEKLDLSVKTIENQMGKALRIMRMHLTEYLPMVFQMIILTISASMAL